MLYITLLWSNNNAYWLFDSCNNPYLCGRFTNDGRDSLVRRHFYSSEHNYYGRRGLYEFRRRKRARNQ